MAEQVLITGASGLIGRELINQLLEKEHRVSVLSRRPGQDARFATYIWDPETAYLDPKALEGVTTVIHLAGEPISEGPWTAAQKQRVIDSRVRTAGMLFDAIQRHGQAVRHFISASGVGYYGDGQDRVLSEDAPAGTDFMARCCVEWELAADRFRQLGLRVSILRTGVVLAKDGGALPVFALPVKLFAAAPLGSGKQWIPWLHLVDSAAAYVFLLENPQFSGIFNLCAPAPVTNDGLTRALARTLHRPVWPFRVPAGLLKIALGERSILPLISTNTSAQKLLDTGFLFRFTDLNDALADLYKSPRS